MLSLLSETVSGRLHRRSSHEARHLLRWRPLGRCPHAVGVCRARYETRYESRHGDLERDATASVLAAFYKAVFELGQGPGGLSTWIGPAVNENAAVHFAVTCAGHTRRMSTSDSLLPSSDDPADTTVAAEPGSGGPRPQFPEEPDLLVGDETDQSLEDALGDERPPFRTPAAGDRLAAEDLRADED